VIPKKNVRNTFLEPWLSEAFVLAKVKHVGNGDSILHRMWSGGHKNICWLRPKSTRRFEYRKLITVRSQHYNFFSVLVHCTIDSRDHQARNLGQGMRSCKCTDKSRSKGFLLVRVVWRLLTHRFPAHMPCRLGLIPFSTLSPTPFPTHCRHQNTRPQSSSGVDFFLFIISDKVRARGNI